MTLDNKPTIVNTSMDEDETCVSHINASVLLEIQIGFSGAYTPQTKALYDQIQDELFQHINAKYGVQLTTEVHGTTLTDMSMQYFESENYPVNGALINPVTH